MELLKIEWKKTEYRKYTHSIELMKLLLTPFICFWAFGFPDKFGVVEALSGFVAPAYFVLSGYCILVEDRDERLGKLKRAMLRSLVFFMQLFVVYFAVNLINPLSSPYLSIEMVKSKRMWFEFLGLNVWPLPIGNSIWFIQSMLYACIVLFIFDKLHILKVYKFLLVILLAFMLIVGEFAGCVGFNFLGYAYIPGGWLTRALPYLLIGMLMREKKESLKNLPTWEYIVLFFIGGGLAIGEIYFLVRIGKAVYPGHMIGYGVMAVAICGLAVVWEDMKRNQLSVHGESFAKRVYAFHNPVYAFLLLFVMSQVPQNGGTFMYFQGVIVYLVSLLICVVISLVKMMLPRHDYDNNDVVL